MKTSNPATGGGCPLTAPPLYETQALRQATGTVLRPGGLSLLNHALDKVRWQAGARILDVGCGTGASVAWLRSHHGLQATGIDPSRKLVEEARKAHPGLPVLRGRAESLPFGDVSLDGLLCECVLSLVPDASQALKEFFRVLRPGGLMILSDIYRRAEPASDAPPGQSCLSGAVGKTTLLQRLQDVGWRVRLWEDHSLLLAELAGRLIFQHGSLAAFWRQFLPDGAAREMMTAVKIMRPGYCLLIAEKVACRDGERLRLSDAISR